MQLMAFKAILLLGLLALFAFASSSSEEEQVPATVVGVSTSLNRTSFPKAFIFGSVSSAYQYEGAANIDGRGPSIWDTFTHKHPEKITDRSNGDVAIDEYHRYKEDVGIMKYMNLDAYRFSISWPRLLPKGKRSGGINQKGVEYYNKLINELLANDFRDFADLCFELFGDRVKQWITTNEPSIFTMNGYALGAFAPGRCSQWLNPNCLDGDSVTEPYIVAHNILLAHAAIVQLYRNKYQAYQKGKIGITLQQGWAIPLTNSTDDIKAAQRSLDFSLGWFLDPLTRGVYPLSMRYLVGDRLPKFSPKEAKLVKGSFDFIGLNYYTSSYFSNSHRLMGKPSYLTDSHTNQTSSRNGVPIGPRAASTWLYIYPKGLPDLLLYIKEKYHNPLIYITENGMDELNDPSLLVEESLIDTYRIDYYYRYLFYV